MNDLKNSIDELTASFKYLAEEIKGVSSVVLEISEIAKPYIVYFKRRQILELSIKKTKIIVFWLGSSWTYRKQLQETIEDLNNLKL